MLLRLLCDWNGRRAGQCLALEPGAARRLIEARVAELAEPSLVRTNRPRVVQEAKGAPKGTRDKMQRRRRSK